MMADDVHYVALKNMKFGTGVELQPLSLFSSSPARHVPNVINLMKVENYEQYNDLVPPTSGTKKKIMVIFVLPPALAEAYQHIDMTPAARMVTTVHHI